MAYTTIDDSSAHFQMALYTGNGGSNAITNGGNSDLQPDWTWIKERSSTSSHQLIDSSRGDASLYSDGTGQEDAINYFTENSDGFTLAANNGINQSSQTNVAWQWKANGGCTATNDASATSVGDTDSVYQVNSTSKFSIVTWTGSGSGTVSIAHGLGSTPKFLIIKQRNGANSWLVYHHKNTIVDDAHDTFLKLHLNNASSADDNNYFMDNTAPTSTVATFGTGNEANQSGTYVGYFFDEVQGYSKFGVYAGNGNANGPFVYTGFKPAWVMVKKVNDSHSWYIQYGSTNIDSGDQGSNPVKSSLQANSNSADATENSMDFLSNGFKIKTSGNGHNTDNGTYIYMAFAEHPFVSSKGVPVTAR